MGTSKLVADIDCVEPIPCNPCQWACPVGAIWIGDDITNLPTVDTEKCTGCGICLGYCPGLAIRLIGPGEEPGRSLVAFAFEYSPVPQKGDRVMAVDKQGRELGEAVVSRVRKPLKDDPTVLVYLDVPEKMAQEVRTMKRW